MVDSLPDAGRMVDDWERDATEKAARFQEMARQVEQVSITESVAGGAVRVTVGHNGLPTDIAMTEQVLRMTPDEIAANVMAGIRKAQSRYPERLGEILAETVGTEDPAAQHILVTAERNFPPVADEEESTGTGGTSSHRRRRRRRRATGAARAAGARPPGRPRRQGGRGRGLR